MKYKVSFVVMLQEVLCHGQTIGAIAAETREIAQKAAALVEVTYENLTPILTIEVIIDNYTFG